MNCVDASCLLETFMKRISLLIITLAAVSGTALADSNLKSGLGGALGGAGGAALGNAIGGSTGAVVGGAVGGATGAAVTTKGKGKTGAVVGGAVGGGAGAAVGNSMGGSTGAVIGAGVGGGSGAALGRQLSKYPDVSGASVWAPPHPDECQPHDGCDDDYTPSGHIRQYQDTHTQQHHGCCINLGPPGNSAALTPAADMRAITFVVHQPALEFWPAFASRPGSENHERHRGETRHNNADHP